MAALVINDLRTDRVLDRKAMASIRGGGAPWVFGWIRPYTSSPASFGTVVNFYQVNNFADQMTNQIQLVDINNTGANSNITVALDEQASNVKQL